MFLEIFYIKVYSFNSELFKVTGVQKVLMDVHHAIMGEYDAKIVGTVPYDKLHKVLGVFIMMNI